LSLCRDTSILGTRIGLNKAPLNGTDPPQELGSKLKDGLRAPHTTKASTATGSKVWETLRYEYLADYGTIDDEGFQGLTQVNPRCNNSECHRYLVR